MKQEVDVMDAADDPFIPEVDLSRPWVNVNTSLDSPALETKRNISIALSNIPWETRAQMGFSLNNMLQECTWDGRKCALR